MLHRKSRYGGLEYKPAILEPVSNTKKIEVARLVELSNKILDQDAGLEGVLTGSDDREAMKDFLRVGTSAGGARAKAILAWNPTTNEFRSGQVAISPDYEHWIIKFDGITNNRDKEITNPQGYGKIEYIYYLMVKKAGIEMTQCRLHHEGGRGHFMTKRFDRMNRRGEWRLSPAFDISYAYDPKGDWMSKHQMSINGKRDMFTREDL